MQIHDLSSILHEQDTSNSPYQEFLRVPAVSMGVYKLHAGQEDEQQPHTEDEVYYVLSGKARFQQEDKSQPVGQGSIIYVERLTAHRFVNITEDLTVLVFFAMAEGSAENR